MSPQAGVFVDDQGAPTSLTMTWYADKEAGSDGAAATSDERLMKGFLEGYSSFSQSPFAVRVEVANVPYDRYKVVPYLIGFGFDTTASVRLGGQQYYYVQSSNFTADGFIQATATSLANAQTATYAVFDDQTADHFTLDIVTEDGNRGALAGLQIIETSPGPLMGDYNVDGSVDAADFLVWRKNVGNIVPACSRGDANCNGFVENADYQPWKANFGSTQAGVKTPPAGGSLSSLASVPEPSALLSCALAIVLLAPVRFGARVPLLACPAVRSNRAGATTGPPQRIGRGRLAQQCDRLLRPNPFTSGSLPLVAAGDSPWRAGMGPNEHGRLNVAGHRRAALVAVR